MIIFNQLMEKNVKKNDKNFFFNDKKNFKKSRKECDHSNDSGEKSLIFFFLVCATQNKALDMMKLVTIYFIEEFMV